MNNKIFISLVALLLCRDFMLTAGNTWSNTHRRRDTEQQWQRDCQAIQQAKIFVSAAGNGNIRKLKAMIKSGVDVEVTNLFGTTALACAIHNQQLEAVHFLLEKRASITDEDSLGRTPVMFAVEGIHEVNHTPEILHLLLRHHPSRHTLTNNKWVQWLSRYHDPQVTILDEAIQEIESDRESSIVAELVLMTQTKFPSPIIGEVQSFISTRQETLEEQAQTLRLLETLNKKSSKTRRSK